MLIREWLVAENAIIAPVERHAGVARANDNRIVIEGSLAPGRVAPVITLASSRRTKIICCEAGDELRWHHEPAPLVLSDGVRLVWHAYWPQIVWLVDVFLISIVGVFRRMSS